MPPPPFASRPRTAASNRSAFFGGRSMDSVSPIEAPSRADAMTTPSPRWRVIATGAQSPIAQTIINLRFARASEKRIYFMLWWVKLCVHPCELTRSNLNPCCKPKSPPIRSRSSRHRSASRLPAGASGGLGRLLVHEGGEQAALRLGRALVIGKFEAIGVELLAQQQQRAQAQHA